MNITKAKYCLNEDGNANQVIVVTIDGKELFVPLDPNNRHYIEIMKQVEEGTLTIEDAD
tara:strand:+ start:970 stop:1146 length:177 start_codon:yes stop_codon:yes gene_type:complete